MKNKAFSLVLSTLMLFSVLMPDHIFAEESMFFDAKTNDVEQVLKLEASVDSEEIPAEEAAESKNTVDEAYFEPTEEESVINFEETVFPESFEEASLSEETEETEKVVLDEAMTWEAGDINEVPVNLAATTVASGSCGTKVTYKLDSDGILTISGSGVMKDYTYNSSPWYSKRTSVKKVVIENGVTSIGNYAFYDCSSLTSVTIGNSVTSIGNYAFCGCSSLTSVTIPDSVTSIGNSAFYDCSSLTSVTIPDSVTSIGNSAFNDCSSLTSVTIGNSVTSIGNYALYGCSSLTSVTIPDSVTSIGNYAFCGCRSLTSVTIPDSVTSIGEVAFWKCSSLTSVTIGDSVTSIGDNAFYDCLSLTDVYISDLDAWCRIEFEDYDSNPIWYAGELYINGEPVTNVVIPNDVTKVNDYLFYNCRSLTSVTIPDSVTSIGISAFRKCSSLTSVTIPDSVTSIGNYAFYGCSSLTSVTIPDSVTSIGNYAFCGCSSLASITIPNNVTSIGNDTFRECINLSSVIIPNSVMLIERNAFLDCCNLVNIFLGNGIKTIEQSAFGFFRLGNSTNKVRHIFYAGSNEEWQNVYIERENEDLEVTLNCRIIFDGDVTYVVKDEQSASVFRGDGKNIIIKEEIENIPITSILERAFYGCSTLEEITLPFIGASADADTDDNSVLGYIFGKGDSYSDGVTAQHYSTSLGNRYYYIPKTLKKVTITNDTTIPYGAFSNCDFITEINLPANVTSIGGHAFWGCSSLTSVTIPGSVTSIGEGAFSGCSSTTEIHYQGTRQKWKRCFSMVNYIPSCITLCYKIGDNIYWKYDKTTQHLCITGSGEMVNFSDTKQEWYLYASEIRSVSISEGITNIGQHAFCNCIGITEISLPSSVQNIADYAFDFAIGLKKVSIPSGVTIGKQAFVSCISLDTIDTGTLSGIKLGALEGTAWLNRQPDGPVYLGKVLYCYKGTMPANTKLTISPGTVSITEETFKNFDNLQSVTIPGSVTSIGDSVFYDCDNLTSVAIPNSATSIGAYAFYSCGRLTSVTIPASVTKIKNNAFCLCSKLKNITFQNPSLIQYIGKDAFCYTQWWDSQPDEVVYVGSIACGFKGSGSSATIKPGTKYISPNAFYGTSLTSVVLPDGLERIEEYAFCNADLVMITIPETVKHIGYNAFGYCASLALATISETTTDISDNAFYGCSHLKIACLENGLVHQYAKECSIATLLTAGYSVTYDANGGSDSPGIQACWVEDNIIILSDKTPTRDGYHFMGWATSANGVVIHQPGETINPTGSVTLYAIWGQLHEIFVNDKKLSFYPSGTKSATFYVALYDKKGRMKDLQAFDAVDGLDVFFDDLEPGDYTKVMYWETSNTAVKPTLSAQEIVLK